MSAGGRCWEWAGGGPGQRAWLQPAPLGHTGTKLLEMKEWYQNREDMLELRHIHKDTGLIIDYFKPGHPQALRGEWTPLPGQPGPPAGPSTLLRAAPCDWRVAGRTRVRVATGASSSQPGVRGKHRRRKEM